MDPFALPDPLPHACIVTGGSGSERRSYARRLAAAYLCMEKDPPCGRCIHCEKVAKGIHPDVYFLAPLEGKREISAADARKARADVYIRPNEGPGKVYLIDPADALNPTAQNVLLKVLEDGPDYAAFVLLCDQPGKLLDTVRSRCETIALPPREDPMDPELKRRGEELARRLLHGSEWDAVQYAAALENEKFAGEKLSAAQVLKLLSAAEEAAALELGRSRRAVPVLSALKQCRENAVYNPGAGHMLGWLCAELFQ